ncbi:unnamed protein product [Larinioides sclopetarius]|uniref:Uncharacterized protein n=1 Tax=Larinioides sclopetarius TaxID=280406 RepID=A0AAV2A6W1_9ARAC
MIRTRSQSRGRSDSNPDSDSFAGVTRRGNRYSLGGHDPRSPTRKTRRHSESRVEYRRSDSGVEYERVQRSVQLLFFENLIVNVSQTLDILGKKIQAILGSLLELILNCLVHFVLLVRRIVRLTSNEYDRKAARNDVLSFLWVGFWSLVVTLFFVPPNLEVNIIKRWARFAVGTFQTTGLLFVLFFMLYLYKITH